MNLGVPKYMVVWKRNQRYGAKTCGAAAVVAEKYPYNFFEKIETESKTNKEKKRKQKENTKKMTSN